MSTNTGHGNAASLKHALEVKGIGVQAGHCCKTIFIPQACAITLKRESWEVPPIFDFLRHAGNVEEQEMLRVFNNGIGMVVVVPEPVAQDVLARLSAMNEKAYVIGEIVERDANGDDRFKWV